MLWLGVSVTSIFNDVVMEQVLAQTGGYERLEAGEALHRAGRITRAEPASIGIRGTVQDGGVERRVWVGVRQWLVVGECDCPDADPLVSSEGHLAAVAAGRAETVGPCAHAVALALSAMDRKLPWATPPREPRPGTSRGPRTTPPAPLDITSLFPGLGPFARQTVRLHPRRGQPGPQDSSMGGPLLWPASEPWPVCTEPHVHNWEWADVPPEITSWEEADAWARSTLGLQARVARNTQRPARADIDRSRPAGVPSPMISVLQLHAREVPGVPFPAGTDCFQLLWCPNHHLGDTYPTLGGLRLAAFWRRAAAVTELLGSSPGPSFDTAMNASTYQPFPCVLNPEQVTEYPSWSWYP